MRCSKRSWLTFKTTLTNLQEPKFCRADVLKVFIAPEFFWRGKDGAYVFYNESDPSSSQTRLDRYFSEADISDDCTEICHILKGLEELVADPKYKDFTVETSNEGY